ncbi:hypothetical protein AVEN_86845-1 [Araneus ventricosus]|uniref:Uncharacterized protein n=1 Tax=Araneus ventricosus TaxID=182803 RepID=A0A4Y2D1I3_ARAVE|nr:hypothetical protein AVEN_86845-1 [Araneus ventricosus]
MFSISYHPRFIQLSKTENFVTKGLIIEVKKQAGERETGYFRHLRLLGQVELTFKFNGRELNAKRVVTPKNHEGQHRPNNGMNLLSAFNTNYFSLTCNLHAALNCFRYRKQRKW